MAACFRPDCYVRFVVTTRSSRQCYCSSACRNALRRVRLSVPESERALLDSLKRYGQMAPLVMALLDRVVDRAVLLNVLGKLYRASRAKRSKAPRPPQPNT